MTDTDLLALLEKRHDLAARRCFVALERALTLGRDFVHETVSLADLHNALHRVDEERSLLRECTREIDMLLDRCDKETT